MAKPCGTPSRSQEWSKPEASRPENKAAVDDIHPLATNLLAGMALAVFAALTLGAWSLAVPWPDQARPAGQPAYPEPQLEAQLRQLRALA